MVQDSHPSVANLNKKQQNVNNKPGNFLMHKIIYDSFYFHAAGMDDQSDRPVAPV